jgi:phosphoglycolate phosphatase
MATHILFDLDGTLADSAPGILNALRASLHKLHIKPYADQEHIRFIGPPLEEPFQKLYKLNPAKTETAVSYYREYYLNRGYKESRLYPGVGTMLEQLRKKGKRLIIATGKSEPVAEKILIHFGIADHFCLIRGKGSYKNTSSKTDLVGKILAETRISPQQVAMVGDREDDIRAGRENGITSIGVTYGYGSTEELRKAGADRLVQSVSALAQYLLTL